ncbi:SRPBCC family protein [Hamadaea tsunoensis]|uniref:SRPBCC family protein n=1 Tax=Hamadaea tsunoensis TaxID=53368 RepID=UPI0004211DCF|nr:SRPBCC family protein [Hamadaea tsunoensis]
MGRAWEKPEEVVVAASVEEVWDAIATGPGIDSWFMGRSQVDPGPEGSVTTEVGGYAMTSAVTAWDPPNHFAYRGDGPGERFVAFEYLIEGRDRSSTVLRMVASGFLPGDDWDEEFEAMTFGGEMYFRTLVAYLDHFAGRFATSVDVMGPPVTDWPPAWDALRTRLGLSDRPAVGDPVRLTVPGVAALDGQVDFVNAQALGIRTADGLYRFIQGFVGSFVLGVHAFTDIDEHKVHQAWTSWLAGI